MKTDIVDLQNEVCACGSVFPKHSPGYCGGSGYSLLPTGERICYACEDKRQIEELKTRRPCVGYVSADGTQITTWTGGHLMRITWSVPCKMPRCDRDFHSESYSSVNAVDVHGGLWYGRGIKGMAIRLRPKKHS